LRVAIAVGVEALSNEAAKRIDLAGSCSDQHGHLRIDLLHFLKCFESSFLVRQAQGHEHDVELEILELFHERFGILDDLQRVGGRFQVESQELNFGIVVPTDQDSHYPLQ